jgi:hypothetical protein
MFPSAEGNVDQEMFFTYEHPLPYDHIKNLEHGALKSFLLLLHVIEEWLSIVEDPPSFVLAKL